MGILAAAFKLFPIDVSWSRVGDAAIVSHL